MSKKIRSAEAAEMIGISQATLRTWRTIGKGPPYYKIGYEVRYDRADVEAWIEKRKVTR